MYCIVVIATVAVAVLLLCVLHYCSNCYCTVVIVTAAVAVVALFYIITINKRIMPNSLLLPSKGLIPHQRGPGLRGRGHEAFGTQP